MTPRDARAALPENVERLLSAYGTAVADVYESGTVSRDGTLRAEKNALDALVAAILSYGASERVNEREQLYRTACVFCRSPEKYPIYDHEGRWCHHGPVGTGENSIVVEPWRLLCTADAIRRVALAAGPGGEGGGSDA